MSGFTFNRGYATFDPDIQTPYVNNWTIGYQRELWRDAAHRGPLRRQPRQQPLAPLQPQRDRTSSRTASSTSSGTRSATSQINPANGRTGFANNGLPGQVALPIFDAAFGPRGSSRRLPPSAGYNNTTFITAAAAGPGRPPREHARPGRLPLSLPDGRQRAARLRAAAATTPPARTRSTSSRRTRSRPASNVRLLTDEAASEYDALQLQFRQRYRRGLSLTANYTYGKARTDRYADQRRQQRRLHHAARQGAQLGADGLRPAPHFQAYWTYELPFGDGRRFDIDNALLNQIFGGWAASGIVRIQTGRPFLLTERTADLQPAGRRRDPERHHRRRAAEDGQRPARRRTATSTSSIER